MKGPARVGPGSHWLAGLGRDRVPHSALAGSQSVARLTSLTRQTLLITQTGILHFSFFFPPLSSCCEVRTHLEWNCNFPFRLEMRRGVEVSLDFGKPQCIAWANIIGRLRQDELTREVRLQRCSDQTLQRVDPSEAAAMFEKARRKGGRRGARGCVRTAIDRFFIRRRRAAFGKP